LLESLIVYRHFQQRLTQRLRDFLRRQYGLELAQVVVEQPPRVEMGEYALPLSFELAKKLRKPPRRIAEEIIAGLGPVEGFERLEVAGAGYINARLERAEAAAAIAHAAEATPAMVAGEKVLIEHTSINPNKAAHIGHLRNAILGDTFVRLLRSTGRQVHVQNYIDNTGVQVADVVVGLTSLERKSQAAIAALAAEPRFDYYCWDLYARVSRWYEQDQRNLEARLKTLHQIEAGGNPMAEIAEMVSTAILRRHLETMERLGIVYDFLPRESEILRLQFWELAFAHLRERGVAYLESEGKNRGCWVMKRGAPAATPAQGQEREADIEDTKVLVRSNGTVTYVGKDIAYHLWKFGLLGRDFGYRRFYRYPDGHQCWISAESGEAAHPDFGGVTAIYNVIDARQSQPQNQVIEALRALGYARQADHYTHFSYEMVALTPRCAAEMGYALSAEEQERTFIEVSGRKGFGVKADDLMDALLASARREVDSRHAGLDDSERGDIALEIAVGALRYFMLKFTKNSVIAFDFKEALSFEGETGPYAQYAVVRAGNIFRKGDLDAGEVLAAKTDFRFLQDEAGSEIWELWLASAKLSHVVEQSIATTEPAYLAKHAFQLAQLFNNFYHRHHILSEADRERKQFLLATAGVVRRELIRALEMMGISVPPVM